LPYSSCSSSSSSAALAAGAAAAAGHNTVEHTARKCRAQRHLANRHAMRVSGSDSYALLFLFSQLLLLLILIFL